MQPDLWSDVDAYISEKLLPYDATLEDTLKSSDESGLPNYAVTGPQGKYLYLLSRIHRARRILEIGTLGGYSTIWLARAVPEDGQVVSLELNPSYAAVANANLKAAGLSDRVNIRIGAATDTLDQLFAENMAPFDLIFIDADKVNNPRYLELSLRLSRPGTVIVCDNVVRGGEVINATTADPSVIGTRRFFDLVAQNKRLTATAIQTVGAKGYDGFCLAIVE